MDYIGFENRCLVFSHFILVLFVCLYSYGPRESFVQTDTYIGVCDDDFIWNKVQIRKINTRK